MVNIMTCNRKVFVCLVCFVSFLLVIQTKLWITFGSWHQVAGAMKQHSKTDLDVPSSNDVVVTMINPAAMAAGTVSSSQHHGLNATHRLSPPKKYMFAMRILEQLTMSTIHFHQLLNLANDWGAFTGVEPFIYDTSMFGLRSVHDNANLRSFVPFSKLFNASQHNDYLSRCMKRAPDADTGYPVLFEPMSEFLRRSHRSIVLVYFAAHTPEVLNLNIRSRVESEINRMKGTLSDCTSASRKHGMANYVEDHLAKELDIERAHPSDRPLSEHLEGFNVMRAFCIKRDIKIELHNLRDFILDHIPGGESGNFSIIFISWQGRFTHPLAASDDNYINKCRIPFSQPFHTDFIMNTAKRFIQSLNFWGQPYLSVHIRFEKLYFFAFQHHKKVEAYLGCCMSRLDKLITKVTQKFNISSDSVLLLWDYSPHGSLTCPYDHDVKKCTDLAGKYLQKIKSRALYFDPTKFNTSSLHSIVALVESESLHGGRALVTVGGGSYQTSIATAFIERHRDQLNSNNTAAPLHFGYLCASPENLHGLKVDCS